MPIGNPVTLTSNVASKAISVTATASQTLFNVTGGYRINSLGVFKNGLRLQDGVDYTARDGLTVTLLSAASGGDKLQFVVFDTFRVAEAIRPAVDEQTIRGNLNVVGILSATDLEGPLSFNLTSGIQTFHDVRVGGALTVAGTLTYEDTSNSNVTGIATFSDQVSIGDSIFHTGDTDTSIRFPAADTFTVETAGSERVRVTSAGRLGIGTPEPGRQLTLDHASQAEIGLLSGTDTNGGLIYHNASEQKVLIANRESDGHISFQSGGVNERLRITSAGNIGIKTDTPAAPLHVDSDNAYGSFVLSRDGGVSGRRPFGFGISGATDANFRISASGDTLSENAFDNQIIDITAAGNVGIGSLIPQKKLDVAGDVKILDNSPRLEFHDANSGSLSNVTGGFETFDKSGNRATYVGAGMANGGNIVEFGTNNTFRAIIDSSGNVGVGTNNPGTSLEVFTDNDTDISDSSGTNNTNSILRLFNKNGSDGTGVDNYIGIRFDVANGATSSAYLNYVRTGDNQGAFLFKARNAASSYPEMLRITSAGKVGINSEGTAAYLTIRDSEDGGDGNNGSGVLRFSRRNGSATNDAILYAVHDGSDGVSALRFNLGGSERVRVDSSGRVGINSTVGSGTELLQIDGSGADTAFIKLKRTNGAGDDSAYGGMTIIDNNAVNVGRAEFRNQDSTARSQFVISTYTSGSLGVRVRVRGDGAVLPGSDNSQDLGSTSLRWANIYSADLQLSNEGMGNDVDGTWGQYTIQEGENDLFLLNRRNGKKYRFMLEEV